MTQCKECGACVDCAAGHFVGCSEGPSPSHQRRLSGLLRDGARVAMALADTLDEMAAAPEVKR